MKKNELNLSLKDYFKIYLLNLLNNNPCIVLLNFLSKFYFSKYKNQIFDLLLV
jgi:hypothetical protein